MSENYQLGLTKPFPCSYLPSQEERLLVAVDPILQNAAHYTWLMHQGFRRSGNDIYRPHCQSCQACKSIRLQVADFKPSNSQKRALKRGQHFSVQISYSIKDSYYPLYEKYINEIHNDGAMFPATLAQFESFTENEITDQLYLEIYHDKQLISVGVCDDLNNALSAVYTFYHPDYRKYGLGVLSILKQIEICRQLQREILYLGYQIDQCEKMNYKSRFKPHQILIDNQWKTVNT